MACISVLVGQCGNQLGADFFHAVAEAAAASNDTAFQHAVSTSFFRRPNAKGGVALPIARCVLVDMEPKAIEDCRRRVAASGRFQLGTLDRCVTKNDGSGNNWACGYFGQGASRSDAIAEQIRLEVGRADAVACFHVVHSVAGGTGSGVGCLVSDIIREAYPSVPLLHSTVWPFAQGEVMTQWLNCVLSLHVLDETADAVFVLSNDDADAAVSKVLAGGGGATRSKAKLVSGPMAHGFAAINHVLSLQLGALLMPSFSVAVPLPQMAEATKPKRLAAGASRAGSADAIGGEGSTFKCPATFSDSILALALNPRRKFFHAALLPVPTFDVATRAPLEGAISGWKSCVTETLRSARRSGAEAAMLVLRGPQAFSAGVSSVGPALYQNELPLNGLHVADIPLGPALKGPSAVCLHASDAFAAPLARCASKVETFLEVGAYVHHYERYGVSTDDITDALLHVWSLADGYGWRMGSDGTEEPGSPTDIQGYCDDAYV